MPKKSARFIIEFSGHQNCRIDEGNTVLRPLNAAEIMRGLADEIQRRLDDAGQSKFKVTVKSL
jgi:hypothetical protein